MFELNLLSLVINNCATINVRKDKQHYRLDFYILKSKISYLLLNELINKVTKEVEFLYNTKLNRYYLHGHNAIKALELFEKLDVIDCLIETESNSFISKVRNILHNKELFTRSMGKPYSEEERNALEQLSKEFKNND